jgi:branched-chain amino acid transport system ATP-binding protein
MAEYNEEVLVGLQGKLTALKGAFSTENHPQLKSELKEEIQKYENIISLYNPKNDNVLKISNLYMQFGGLKVIKNLSFDIKRGEIFGLIGPNGAGKTTVFNCVTQFYKPTSGDIRFKNSHNEIVNLLELKVHDVIDYGVVRTFQNIELITELTILENMLVGAHKSYRSNLFKQMFHTKSLMEEEKVTRAKALKILEEFGLLEYKDNYPVGLPYGVLKRIEFARTLMLNPELIILDEPAAGLNESETIELTQFIKDVRDKYNVTIFLVEHDMGLVMNVCDRICAISFGEHLITGTPDEVKNDKKVQEAYLGGE